MKPEHRSIAGKALKQSVVYFTQVLVTAGTSQLANSSYNVAYLSLVMDVG